MPKPSFSHSCISKAADEPKTCQDYADSIRRLILYVIINGFVDSDYINTIRNKLCMFHEFNLCVFRKEKVYPWCPNIDELLDNYIDVEIRYVYKEEDCQDKSNYIIEKEIISKDKILCNLFALFKGRLNYVQNTTLTKNEKKQVYLEIYKFFLTLPYREYPLYEQIASELERKSGLESILTKLQNRPITHPCHNECDHDILDLYNLLTDAKNFIKEDGFQFTPIKATPITAFKEFSDLLPTNRLSDKSNTSRNERTTEDFGEESAIIPIKAETTDDASSDDTNPQNDESGNDSLSKSDSHKTPTNNTDLGNSGAYGDCGSSQTESSFQGSITVCGKEQNIDSSQSLQPQIKKDNGNDENHSPQSCGLKNCTLDSAKCGELNSSKNSDKLMNVKSKLDAQDTSKLGKRKNLETYIENSAKIQKLIKNSVESFENWIFDEKCIEATWPRPVEDVALITTVEGIPLDRIPSTLWGKEKENKINLKDDTRIETIAPLPPFKSNEQKEEDTAVADALIMLANLSMEFSSNGSEIRDTPPGKRIDKNKVKVERLNPPFLKQNDFTSINIDYEEPLDKIVYPDAHMSPENSCDSGTSNSNEDDQQLYLALPLDLRKKSKNMAERKSYGVNESNLEPQSNSVITSKSPINSDLIKKLSKRLEKGGNGKRLLDLSSIADIEETIDSVVNNCTKPNRGRRKSSAPTKSPKLKDDLEKNKSNISENTNKNLESSLSVDDQTISKSGQRRSTRKINKSLKCNKILSETSSAEINASNEEFVNIKEISTNLKQTKSRTRKKSVTTQIEDKISLSQENNVDVENNKPLLQSINEEHVNTTTTIIDSNRKLKPNRRKTKNSSLDTRDTTDNRKVDPVDVPVNNVDINVKEPFENVDNITKNGIDVKSRPNPRKKQKSHVLKPEGNKDSTNNSKIDTLAVPLTVNTINSKEHVEDVLKSNVKLKSRRRKSKNTVSDLETEINSTNHSQIDPVTVPINLDNNINKECQENIQKTTESSINIDKNSKNMECSISDDKIEENNTNSSEIDVVIPSITDKLKIKSKRKSKSQFNSKQPSESENFETQQDQILQDSDLSAKTPFNILEDDKPKENIQQKEISNDTVVKCSESEESCKMNDLKDESNKTVDIESIQSDEEQAIRKIMNKKRGRSSSGYSDSIKVPIALSAVNKNDNLLPNVEKHPVCSRVEPETEVVFEETKEIANIIRKRRGSQFRENEIKNEPTKIDLVSNQKEHNEKKHIQSNVVEAEKLTNDTSIIYDDLESTEIEINKDNERNCNPNKKVNEEKTVAPQLKKTEAETVSLESKSGLNYNEPKGSVPSKAEVIVENSQPVMVPKIAEEVQNTNANVSIDIVSNDKNKPVTKTPTETVSGDYTDRDIPLTAVVLGNNGKFDQDLNVLIEAASANTTINGKCSPKRKLDDEILQEIETPSKKICSEFSPIFDVENFISKSQGLDESMVFVNPNIVIQADDSSSDITPFPIFSTSPTITTTTTITTPPSLPTTFEDPLSNILPPLADSIILPDIPTKGGNEEFYDQFVGSSQEKKYIPKEHIMSNEKTNTDNLDPNSEETLANHNEMAVKHILEIQVNQIDSNADTEEPAMGLTDLGYFNNDNDYENESLYEHTIEQFKSQTKSDLAGQPILANEEELAPPPSFYINELSANNDLNPTIPLTTNSIVDNDLNLHVEVTEMKPSNEKSNRPVVNEKPVKKISNRSQENTTKKESDIDIPIFQKKLRNSIPVRVYAGKPVKTNQTKPIAELKVRTDLIYQPNENAGKATPTSNSSKNHCLYNSDKNKSILKSPVADVKPADNLVSPENEKHSIANILKDSSHSVGFSQRTEKIVSSVSNPNLSTTTTSTNTNPSLANTSFPIFSPSKDKMRHDRRSNDLHLSQRKTDTLKHESDERKSDRGSQAKIESRRPSDSTEELERKAELLKRELEKEEKKNSSHSKTVHSSQPGNIDFLKRKYDELSRDHSQNKTDNYPKAVKTESGRRSSSDYYQRSDSRSQQVNGRTSSYPNSQDIRMSKRQSSTSSSSFRHTGSRPSSDGYQSTYVPSQPTHKYQTQSINGATDNRVSYSYREYSKKNQQMATSRQSSSASRSSSRLYSGVNSNNYKVDSGYGGSNYSGSSQNGFAEPDDFQSMGSSSNRKSNPLYFNPDRLAELKKRNKDKPPTSSKDDEYWGDKLAPYIEGDSPLQESLKKVKKKL